MNETPGLTMIRTNSIAAVLLAFLLCGCSSGPDLLKPEDQKLVDRSVVEYPAGAEMRLVVENLTAPSAIAFDPDGTLLIAEGGIAEYDPRVIAFRPDGTLVEIYPKGRRFPLNLGGDPFRMRGPIGGMAVAGGRIYISHRDDNGRGVITAFGYDGSHKTIVADLPAQGDHSVTDVAVAPNGRIFFGVGAATNSGVVGIDNMPWLREHRPLCDQPWGELYLLGRRFDTANPFAGLFGGTDIAVTAPFQPFGKSIDTRIPAATNSKPNAAIYSVDPSGGDLRVEAHGIRNPVGLGFSELGSLFFTNQGMKLRGTRPVKDDPDVMLRWVHGQWYGWPDFSGNLLPIRDQRFQPPGEMIVRTGYRDLSFLIDHESSGLTPPNPKGNLLAAQFKPLSGASKFDFAPASGPFARLRQGGIVALVALSGDRAPFDNAGLKLTGALGYRVMQVNIDEGSAKDFIRNTREHPASTTRDKLALERPTDVKFGPDGSLYILDFGQLEVHQGKASAPRGTGRIYRLTGTPEK